MSGKESGAILHPTDFSEACLGAFRVACSLARDVGVRVHVLHVMSPAAEDDARSEDDAARLRNQLQKLQDAAPENRLECLLRVGDPHTEIARAAAELCCSMVVLGAHTWARGDRLLMGSVTQAVFSTAPCTVVIVRPALPEQLTARLADATLT